MSKPRSSWLDYIVYLAVRALVCIIQALPVGVAWTLADFCAWLAYRVNRRHREVARGNIRAAFPDLTEAEVDRRVRAVYRHFCTMIFEMVWMPRKFHRNNLERYLRYADPEEYKVVLRLVKSERLLLIVLGHLGNWEMFAYACGLAGFRASVVARRLDNPYLDRFLKRFRIATGQTILDKNRDYEKIQEQLERGHLLAIIGDQDAGPRGMFVDFFGIPASTHKSIALWALEYSAPIMVFGSARRSRPLHYDLYMADVIRPEEYRHNANPVRDLTQRFTSTLEKLIRAHPDQYFWLHRRWKHKPPVRRELRRAG